MVKKFRLLSIVAFLIINLSGVYAKQSKEEIIQKLRKIQEEKMQLLQKKIQIQLELQKKLEEIKKENRETRLRAIRDYEKYIKSAPASERKTEKYADALYQLGMLYYDEEKQAYEEAYDKYMKNLKLYEKKKLKKAPQEPSKKYDKALKYFGMLLRNFPNYADRDVVLYKVGVIYEELGSPRKGLPYFMELAKRYPKSKYAERAYLRVGAFYYEEGKIDSALSFYQRVSMEGAGVENWGLAQYQIAKCYARMDEKEKAVAQFFKYIQLVDQGYFRKQTFRTEAMLDLASIYAELKNGVKKCETHIQIYYPKLASEEPFLFYKIGEKAREYDKNDNALEAFTYLLEKYPYYPDAPKAMAQVVDIYVLMHKYKEANDARIKLVELYNKNSAWAQRIKDPKKVMLAQEFVKSALELIPLYFHQKADKSKNEDYYKQAIKYYEMYLQWFADADPFKTYEFRFYLASCYLAMKEYRKAAQTFDAIVTMDTSKFPQDRLKKLKFDKETAAYNAVLAYKGIMDETIKDFEKEYNSQAVQEFIAASERYLKLFRDREAADEILINLAAVYYKAKKYMKAAKIYKLMVDSMKKSKFYFDAYKYLAQSYIYANKYVEGEKIMMQYLEEFPNMSKDDKDKALILLGSAIFKQGEYARDSLKDYDKAIYHFMRIHKIAPQSKVADVGIQNAAYLYEKMGKYKEAAKTYIYLQKTYPKSKYAIPSLLRAAFVYKRDSLYDSAAYAYELIAKNYNDSDASYKAIYEAALMYDSLKMYVKAAKEYEKVQDLVSPKLDKAAEGLYFAGLMYEKAEDWDNAFRVYREIEKKYPNSTYLTEALYSIAIIYEKRKEWKKASEYFENYADKYLKKNIKLGFDAYVKAAEDELKIDNPNFERANKLLDKAYDVYQKYAQKVGISDYYAAKILFLKGEVARLRMESIPFGGYKVYMAKGELKMDKLDEKADKKKQEYLKEAIETYANVAKMKVEEWTLKANNAIGFMMYKYAEDFDNQKLVVKARNSAEKKSLEIGIKIKVIKDNAKNLYLKAYERFKVNVEYGIKNRVLTDAIDTAKIWMPKCAYVAATKYFEMAKLFRESPVPPELKGTEDEEYFRAELEDKAAQMEELALPLLEAALKECYSMYIDNEWTTKIKDKIRELNANSKALLLTVATPEQPIVRKGKEDIEVKLALEQIDKILQSDQINYTEKLTQLRNLMVTAKRRIIEEKTKQEKLKVTIDAYNKVIDKITKDIFKIGGGQIEQSTQEQGTQENESTEVDNKEEVKEDNSNNSTATPEGTEDVPSENTKQ